MYEYGWWSSFSFTSDSQSLSQNFLLVLDWHHLLHYWFYVYSQKLATWKSGLDKENKNQCLFCNAIFSRKEHLKRHEDSIHKNIKFDCQDCGKQFKQKGMLTIHINIVHKGIKYKCHQCDKEFTSPANRNTHIKSVHEQKKISLYIVWLSSNNT